jgi:hypothetical protein
MLKVATEKENISEKMDKVSLKSPRKAFSKNERNLPVKQPELKNLELETDGDEIASGVASPVVGAIAHKTASYSFDLSKEPLPRQSTPIRYLPDPVSRHLANVQES